MSQTVAAPPLPVASSSTGSTFLGHPVGLYVLFFTEMWERMSYYGMRSLLTLYMVDHLFIRPDVGQQVLGYNAVKHGLESVFGVMTVQQLGSQVYGLYTGLVYFTPFFGGLLADRVLGQRRSVVLGGVLMCLGHFLMAFEGLFFVALLFLIFGNGAFKPNISTQVGSLYPEGDPRRDRAFTIFYMGINLGAFLSPLVCGTLGQMVGWHYGFGAAGVGMAVGLVVYLWGQRFLPQEAQAAAAKQEKRTDPLSPSEKKVVVALVVLCALNIVFWGVYEQQGNTMQLWADKNTDWTFLGLFTVPSTWFQSFNPLFIFIFAPLLDRFWAKQSKQGREPSSVTKMAIGCVLLGLAFVVMIAGASVIGEGKGSVMWLVTCTWILTLGELYLSPIGLSLVSKVAPRGRVSMMMGMWFLSSFFGNYMSGFLGTFYETMSKQSFFGMLSALGFLSAVAFWAFNKPLRRAIGGAEGASV